MANFVFDYQVHSHFLADELGKILILYLGHVILHILGTWV